MGKMKKISLLFVGIVVLIAAIFVSVTSVKASTTVTVGDLTYEISGSHATVTKCNVDVYGAVVIPEKIQGYPITKIGSTAFYGCWNMTSVSIPESVTSIESNAFWDCRNLVDIVIPKNVTTIGAYAFDHCIRLQSITIPKSVTSMGYAVFEDCTATIYLNSAYVRDYALNNNQKYVIVPDTISVVKAPNKTEYCLNEESDMTGLQVNTVCFDNSGVDVTSECILSGFDSTKTGEKKITIKYNAYAGYETSFNVKINTHTYDNVYDVNCNKCSYVRSVSGIVIQDYCRTEYCLNETINTEGLSLNVSFDDASNGVATTGFTTSSVSTANAGNKSITVTYGGKTTNLDIIVYASHQYSNDSDDSCNICQFTRKIDNITVKTMPDKTEYIVGENFKTEGLVICANYNDGSVKEITNGYEVSGFDSSVFGTNAVTITYLGKQVRFDVEIKAAATQIAFTKENVKIAFEKTYQCEIVSTPTNAYIGKLTWSSDDKNIATVDANGLITGVGAGMTTVRVTSERGLSAECRVEVALDREIYTSEEWKEIPNGMSGVNYILMADIRVTKSLTIPAGMNISIDLNGHTINGTVASIIVNEGILTIKDSGEAGTLFVQNSSAMAANSVVKNLGTLYLKSGTLQMNSTYEGTDNVIYTLYVVNNYGTFEMSGGTIIAEVNTKANKCNQHLRGISNGDGARLKVTGGTIDVYAKVDNYNYNANSISSTLSGIVNTSTESVSLSGGLIKSIHACNATAGNTTFTVSGVTNMQEALITIDDFFIAVDAVGVAAKLDAAAYGIENLHNGTIDIDTSLIYVVADTNISTKVFGIVNKLSGNIVVGSDDESNTENMIIETKTTDLCDAALGNSQFGTVRIEKGLALGSYGIMNTGNAYIGVNDGTVEAESVLLAGYVEVVVSEGTTWVYDGTFMGEFATNTVNIPSGNSWGHRTEEGVSVYTLKDSPQKLIEQFVIRLYQVCLNRDPDDAGKADWVGRLQQKEITGSGAASGFIFSQEFKNKNLCNADYVEQLYQAFMGRASDEGGKAYWIGNLEAGMTREQVFNGFALSTEFRNLCVSYGIELGNGIPVPVHGTIPTGTCTVCGKEDGVTAFVKRLYSICLNREADEGGLNDWTGQLWARTTTGKQVAFGFIFSQEFINLNLSNEDYVEYLYLAIMGRASDAGGKADWVNRLNHGWSRDAVFNGFAGSTEFNNICNSYGIIRE